MSLTPKQSWYMALREFKVEMGSSALDCPRSSIGGGHMRQPRLLWVAYLMVAAMLLSWSVPAWGQSEATSGAIRGTITDQKGHGSSSQGDGEKPGNRLHPRNAVRGRR